MKQLVSSLGGEASPPVSFLGFNNNSVAFVLSMAKAKTSGRKDLDACHLSKVTGKIRTGHR